jgi:rfaE bifunctional protein kinase chain/domain
MNTARCQEIMSGYVRLKIGLVGDFCLDRYFEIDPQRAETSIETGLEVHNVVNIRNQPGGAGTILNNLVALGVGRIFPIGFCGDDGEGYELVRELQHSPQVFLDHFFQTPERRTFTYGKPLVRSEGQPPRELNRLDIKNWTETPMSLQKRIIHSIQTLKPQLDVLILLDQVDVPQTGVATRYVVQCVGALAAADARLLALGDSRRTLREWPPITFKMNARELALLAQLPPGAALEQLKGAAVRLALERQQRVFVTLAEQGMMCANASGAVSYQPAFPVTGPIDVVGAGDSVMANLACALAAGATDAEALALAATGAAIVLKQLGTTGTATPEQIRETLPGLPG